MDNFNGRMVFDNSKRALAKAFSDVQGVDVNRFKLTQGYIRLEHPQLIVEFLVAERGRGSDKPYSLPQLGINAQSLRFLDMLAQNTINTKVEEFNLTLPHPANFALHKLLILQKRQKPEKITKDRDAGVQILRALIDKGEQDVVRKLFHTLPNRWQKRIHAVLADLNDDKILNIFE